MLVRSMRGMGSAKKRQECDTPPATRFLGLTAWLLFQKNLCFLCMKAIGNPLRDFPAPRIRSN